MPGLVSRIQNEVLQKRFASFGNQHASIDVTAIYHCCNVNAYRCFGISWPVPGSRSGPGLAGLSASPPPMWMSTAASIICPQCLDNGISKFKKVKTLGKTPFSSALIWVQQVGGDLNVSEVYELSQFSCMVKPGSRISEMILKCTTNVVLGRPIQDPIVNQSHLVWMPIKAALAAN